MARQKNAPAVGGTQASGDVAVPPNVRGFDLDAAAERLGIEIPADNDELLDRAVAECSQALRRMALSGIYFGSLKARLPHGEYEKALADRGVSSQRASEAVSFSVFYASLPKDQADKLLSVPKTKAIALARADTEVIDDIIEQGEFEDFTTLSVREMRTQLKNRETELARAEALLEKEREKTAELQARLSHRHDHAALPEWAVVTRHEAAACAAEIGIAIDTLTDLANDNLFDINAAGSQDDADYQEALHMAAGTLYHAVRGEWARLSKLLERVAEAYGEHITVDAMDTFTLSAEEAELAATHASMVQARHDQAKLTRHVSRENTRAGKRGRKMKVPE